MFNRLHLQWFAIGDDWTIDYVNKAIRHTSGTTVYAAVALYSYLQDTFDELGQMDDEVPMSAQTPNAFTLINDWFMDDTSMQFIDDGAIQTSGWNGEIRVIQFSENYTNAISGDRYSGVTGGTTGDTGTLLDFDNTLRKWWVRMDAADDLFDVTETVSVDGGTGTGITAGASKTGETLWANIFTLGTIATNPNPAIYVVQNKTTLTSFWARGQIDILVKVKEADEEIDGANVTVYARQYQDLYDHFDIDLTAGGRNAVPLATSTDLNNTQGTHFLLYDGGNQSTSFTTRDIVTGATSSATAEIIALTVTGSSTGALELGNIIGTFQDNETINGATTGTAVSNGTVGEQFLKFDTLVGNFTVGASVVGQTSSVTGTLRGYSTTTDNDFMVIQDANGAFDDTTPEQIVGGNGGTANVASSTVEVGVAGYEDTSPFQIWFVNGTLAYDGGGGTPFAEGLTVQGGQSFATAIVLADSGNGTTGVLTLANVEGSFVDNEPLTATGSTGNANSADGLKVASTINKAFQLQTTQPYNVVVEMNSRSVLQWYEYTKYLNGEGATGTDGEEIHEFYTYNSDLRIVEFRATGYTNATAADLGLPVKGGTTSDRGTLRAYDNSNRRWTVDLDSVTGDFFDRVESVAVSGGTGTGTTRGMSYLEQQDGEHYTIAYPGWAPVKAAPFGTFAGGTWFGARGIWIQNMVAADAQSFQLIDASGDTQTPPNFQALTVTGMNAGDRVSVFRTTGANNIVDKSIFNITGTIATGATGVDVVETVPSDTPSDGYFRTVERDAGGDIVSEQRYKYASFEQGPPGRFTFSGGVTTDRQYDNQDTGYVPFIDTEAAGSSEAVTVIYTTDRNIVVRVRLKGIIPFEAQGNFQSGGFLISAIRTTDTIVV